MEFIEYNNSESFNEVAKKLGCSIKENSYGKSFMNNNEKHTISIDVLKFTYWNNNYKHLNK